MSSSEESNSRTAYRLRYPAAARPVVRINGLSYPVTELSEAGVRLLVDDDTSSGLKGPLVGYLTFPDQETEVIEGEVARIDRNHADQVEAILLLSQGVSLKRMISEQVRIRSDYLTLIDPADGRPSKDD
ncbi:MAG: PilZ domain-containing protein [Fuerstiella sp.]